ncbi:hypothetical protein J8L88_10315 [Aquimarina sp. MMG015]|uniref:hypothetical protein n=1 Tax=Aquimarina sp. MMG015 TaxID=2822689 RepID=UPI001B3A04DA|nr:hypothetical protein [Aquimarina sp. MMG015]MBQ4803242.1 hypothetical protein [Aquimarina sp. MMG015]
MRQLFLYTFFFIIHFGYCQQEFPASEQDNYFEFLNRIASKDSTINNTYKRYKCSENFFGTIDYYRENEKLRFIIHAYKPHAYEDAILEYYYIENDSLKTNAVFNYIIKYNTKSFESKNVQKFGAEKITEIQEDLSIFSPKMNSLNCFTRMLPSDGESWIKDAYLNKLTLYKKAPCKEAAVEILDKYNQLRKAEKKLITYHRTLGCLFHLW